MIKTSSYFQPPSTSSAPHTANQTPSPRVSFAEIVSTPTTVSDPQSSTSSPQQEATVLHATPQCASSMLFMGDSIFRNVHFDKVKKETRSNIKVVKAYSSVYDTNKNNKFKKSNFTDLMPKELEKAKHDVIVMQASSTDLTNYKDEKNKEVLRQRAQTSNANMLSVATTACATHPDIQKIILFERVTRFDKLQELNEFANQDLHSQWTKCDKEFKDKIIIGKHSLKPHGEFSQAQRLARWGDQRLHQNIDHLHLYGSSGKVQTTNSILSVLSSVGLTETLNLPKAGIKQPSSEPEAPSRQSDSSRQSYSWQEARGRRRGKGKGRNTRRAPDHMQDSFDLPLQNRWTQGNY